MVTASASVNRKNATTLWTILGKDTEKNELTVSLTVLTTLFTDLSGLRIRYLHAGRNVVCNRQRQLRDLPSHVRSAGIGFRIAVRCIGETVHQCVEGIAFASLP